MMFQSAVLALAAVQGVIAQTYTPEWVDACNPVSNNDAACNQVAIMTLACEAKKDAAERKKCFCEGRSGEIFQEMHAKCRECKKAKGLANEAVKRHSANILDATTKAYCGDEIPTDSWNEYYKKAEEKAGPYPTFTPTNLPAKSATGPTEVIPFPPDLFLKLEQHAEVSGHGYKVTADQSVTIVAGVDKKAHAPKPTGAPFPTNTTGGAGADVNIKVELEVLHYNCWCEVSELSPAANVTKVCEAPEVVPAPELKEVSVATIPVECRAAIFVGVQCSVGICVGAQGEITVESNAAVVQASVVASIPVGGHAPAPAPAHPQQQPQQQPSAQKPKATEDCIPAPGQKAAPSQNDATGGKTQVVVDNRISAETSPEAPAAHGAQTPSGPGAQAGSGSQSPSGTSPAGPGAVAPAAPGKSNNANIPEGPKANKSGNANIPQSSGRPAPSTLTGAAVASMHVSALAVAVAALAVAL